MTRLKLTNEDMGQTIGQRDRLRAIREEIEKCHEWASPNVRRAIGCFKESEKLKAVEDVANALQTEDGFASFHIIKAWHESGVHGVVAHSNPKHECVCGFAEYRATGEWPQ